MVADHELDAPRGLVPLPWAVPARQTRCPDSQGPARQTRCRQTRCHPIREGRGRGAKRRWQAQHCASEAEGERGVPVGTGGA